MTSSRFGLQSLWFCSMFMLILIVYIFSAVDRRMAVSTYGPAIPLHHLIVWLFRCRRTFEPLINISVLVRLERAVSLFSLASTHHRLSSSSLSRSSSELISSAFAPRLPGCVFTLYLRICSIYVSCMLRSLWTAGPAMFRPADGYEEASFIDYSLIAHSFPP